MGFYNDILPDETEEFFDRYIPWSIEDLGFPARYWSELVIDWYHGGKPENAFEQFFHDTMQKEIIDNALDLFYNYYFQDVIVPMAEAAADARDAKGDWLHDCRVDRQLDRAE